MGVLAGIVAIAYGALHAAGTGGGEGKIPGWARGLWLAAAALVVVAGGLLIAGNCAAFVLLLVGIAGITGLAVANGVWMHGRTNPRHHAVRAVFSAVTIALAVAAS